MASEGNDRFFIYSNLKLYTKYLYILYITLITNTYITKAWILPGSYPIDHKSGDMIRIKVNKLMSTQTQLPYDYYHLPYPKPKVIEEERENLGEVLLGNKVETSVYRVIMNKDEHCLPAGSPKTLTTKELQLFAKMIDEEYRVNWICENLPVSIYQQMEDRVPGFPVGYVSKNNYNEIINHNNDNNDNNDNNYNIENNHVHILFNHLDIHLGYHVHEDQNRVVEFAVVPRSMDHNIIIVDGKEVIECVDSGSELILENKNEKIGFTYSVNWHKSDMRWVSRWDVYLKVLDPDIHWTTLIISFIIVIFLSIMLGLILLRTLLRDIARYNDIDSVDDVTEESGWKLVHGDVFRRPIKYRLLTVFVGSGVQILGMTVITIIFALIGIVSPTARGTLLQAMLILIACMSLFAGYISARFNKLFISHSSLTSLQIAFSTAHLFPGISFVVFLIINIFLIGKESSGAAPFGIMCKIILLFALISIPLVFFGSYLGYQKPVISFPVRTNQIPRQIPPQPWLSHPITASVVGGILCFSAIYTEMYYILSSLWLHHFYYMFGFLLMVVILLIITCAELAITFTYFQLTVENYHWWWRAFLTSGSSAMFLFIYIVAYFSTSLSITQPVSVMLYFGYMTVLCIGFFLLTGAVGFLATFWFVRAIYGSIKVD